MKKIGFLSCVLAGVLGILATNVSAQVQSVAAANKQTTGKSAAPNPDSRATNATRARVLGPSSKSYVAVPDPTQQAHARKVSKTPAETPSGRPANASADKATFNVGTSRARTVDNLSKTSGSNRNTSGSTLIGNSGSSATSSSQLYRIGVRDVLDIQLGGHSGKQSTLYTVLDGGLIEYPLAGGAIAAAGMTTAEVAAVLRQRLRILDNPSVEVKVRDYASHPVTISGFVAAPGVKYLRRESVPLYTVLAEALMMPEAARATITRQGNTPIVIDLKDSTQAGTLVRSGDTIKVSGVPLVPTEFFFMGGEISSPGQKPYHSGVTLTQAILASGGTTRGAGSKVLVSRQGADGRLVTEQYNLRKIQDGKSPDPALQKGDRIQVTADR
ncbi:MAG TPA: polysaccharide biosynthesis/export family protein [Pyrinomonadaceae bacterium]|nr:polysaccharide biosynthesis/export family protein [Pyrinomonadaceae bacterium]